MPDPSAPTLNAVPGRGEGMTLRFVLRTEDYVMYALSDLRTNPAQVRRTATSRVVLGVGLALWFFYFSGVLGVKNLALQAALGLMAGGLGWFLYPKLIEAIVRRNARTTFKGESEQELVLQPDALIARSEKSEHRFNRSAIEGVVETSDHVFVLLSGRGVVIVPQSAFADSAQRLAFIAAMYLAGTS